ncbi:hypothetical protein [Arthrobacter pascens]|uniref:hypothetical protein n=1 Tax=Arthrobacter pascens TaxID=1677 RepID=UPI0027D8DAAA|nr:hypothetical protein [Arthrobacter pascens]
MLEGKLRLVVDQPAGHHQVAGHPLGTLVFEGLDLVLRGAVKLLARDVFIDLRGAFAVRSVGAAEIAGVRNTGRTVFRTVPAELAGTGVATVEAPRCPVLAVAKRLPVAAAGEAAAFAVTFTTRTITIRLVLPVAIRLPLTAAVGLPLTGTATAVGLPLTGTETAAFAVTFTTRTITIRLFLTVTVRRFTVAVAEGRLTVAVTEGLALTTGTAVGLPLTGTAAAVGLPLTGTETAAFAVTITTRTITIWLVLTVTVRRFTVRVTERLPLTTGTAAAVRLPLTGTRSAAWTIGAVAVLLRTESSGFSARVVRAAERAAVFSVAVAAIVLSHVGFLLL